MQYAYKQHTARLPFPFLAKTCRINIFTVTDASLNDYKNLANIAIHEIRPLRVKASIVHVFNKLYVFKGSHCLPDCLLALLKLLCHGRNETSQMGFLLQKSKDM